MIRHKYAGPTRYDEVYDPREGRAHENIGRGHGHRQPMLMPPRS